MPKPCLILAPIKGNQMLWDWPPEKDWEPSQAEIEMMQKAVTNFRNAK